MKFQDILKEAAKIQAYWITPKSELIPVASNHIDIILDYPQLFGITLNDIKEIYKKHKEPLGEIGGDANREILNIFFNKGWIRIRLNDKLGICLVTIRNAHFSKRIKEDITNFITEYIPNRYINVSDNTRTKYIFKDYDVTITDVEGGLHLKYKSAKIKNGVLIEKTERKLTLHENFNN